MTWRVGTPAGDTGRRSTGESPSRPRLLVLRALGLGDLLTAVPALRALRRRFPGHEIVLAAPGRVADAAAGTGAVDRLLPVSAPGRTVPDVLPWTGPPPDLAVDLHGNGPPSHRLLQALRPGRLLAYAHPGTPGIRGPVWQEDEHERDRWCRLLDWYGIAAEPGDLRIETPSVPSPAPGAVVLHPGADAGARRWPAERFATVARAVRGRGRQVAVTAGRAEGPLARRVADLAGLPPGSVFGGGLDVPFPTLAALVAGARAVVVATPDSPTSRPRSARLPWSCSAPSPPACGDRPPRPATASCGPGTRPAPPAPATRTENGRTTGSSASHRTTYSKPSPRSTLTRRPTRPT